MRHALMILLALPMCAQTPDAAAAKRADLKKIFAITKPGDAGVQSMKQSLPALKQASPQIPDVFWDAFLAEFNAQKVEELILPIYEDNLTAGEVKAYLAFLGTPEGASVARKQPLILKQAMEAGQKLGEQVGREVAERLHAEGKL